MGKINHIKNLNYTAEGAIAPFRIVKFGTSDGNVLQASSSADKLIGVSLPVGANSFAALERLDICRAGLTEVEYGGQVTRGDRLTADANGKAIAITDAMLVAGVVNSIGVAESSGVLGDIGDVFLNGNNFTILPGIQDCTFVVGAEGSDAIIVTGQLKDASGNALTAVANVKAYISDNADGSTLEVTVHSGAVATSSKGLAIPVVAKKVFDVVTNATGAFDLSLTESGTKTAYLVVALPGGSLKVSGAITHAA
jgi:hypothetical protein